MGGKKFEFSNEQKQYIIDNWGKESAHSMKKKFGCTWYAVVGIAKENGLELPVSNDWTTEQKMTLRVLAEKYHYKDIAKIMDKTENAIYLKAKRLKIVLIQDRRGWTTEEEQEFKDLWGNKPLEWIAKKFKRPIFSLKVKAVRMELGPMISNNYEQITISDISELLSVSRDRITKTWASLGLKIEHTKLTNKRSYMTVTWPNLMKFLENNQYEWDSRKVEKNMLGPEPEWLIIKRARDIEENPLWYRIWEDEEIQKAEWLFKNGKDYEYIAKELNRSAWAVDNKLSESGYQKKLDKRRKK